MRLFENVHSKGIRNAIWSLNQTEIVSVSYDQTCALTDAENGDSQVFIFSSINHFIIRINFFRKGEKSN